GGLMLEHDTLRSLALDTLQRYNVPGLALGVVEDSQRTFAEGFGIRSVEEAAIPVGADTLFQIGSTTKPLTGVLIMRLVEAGVLDLDTPIGLWLPDLRLQRDADVAISLRMLLSHTAGLPWNQITPTRLHAYREPDGLARWVREELPSMSFVHPPGTAWSYSNPGINLAAHVAEVAAGQAYAALMQERVFEPLGMERTTFDPLRAMTYPLAQAHQRNESGAPQVIHLAADNAAQYPSAFAWSNVPDLARFARMLLGYGTLDGSMFLRRDSVAEMFAFLAQRSDNPAEAYGLTFQVDIHRLGLRVAHPGGINGYSSEFALFPERGLAVITLANLAPSPAPAELTERILDGVPA
ncbi:MAG: penicillin-binding protein, partial [Chloroflexi bacterium]